MTSERVMLVALENMSTSGVVAAAAAHAAVEQEVSKIVLVHVLDDHLVANAVAGFMMPAPSMAETVEEASSIFELAERTIEAECGAMDHPVPQIVRQCMEGRPGEELARAAQDLGVEAIVVGARRPHALGRLTHPDVADYLRRRSSIPVRVVALQAEAPPAAGSGAR